MSSSNQVNSDKKIQQFLAKAPFTIKDVQITIFNRDSEGRRVYDPEILVAEISDGILTYRTVEVGKSPAFKNRYSETYEEALKIIQRQ